MATDENSNDIRNRIWQLRIEFEEIRFLKRMADELRSLRKKLVTEKCD